jgi:hypothetical protein
MEEIMKAPARITLIVIVLAAFLLAACGAAAPAATELPAEKPAGQELLAPAATQALYQSAPSSDGAQPEQQTKDAGGGPTSNMPGTNVVVQTGADALTSAQTSDRMVIKNAEVRLLVEDTDDAINRMLQVVGDTDSYIISSRAWYQPGPDGKNYKYATVTIGVPVDQFETAMRRLRATAMRVLDENASGQDVSDEYVDLQSQLGNLEATRDRIRSFLDNAQTVEESLRINQELTNIEAQIEQVKGRMNYLANRSAFSTITVTFEPDIPPVTPEPTPTPLPTPAPKPWDPGETFGKATKSITVIYQALIELAIWIFVVIVPLLAPPALILWGIYKFATRKSRKPASG